MPPNNLPVSVVPIPPLPLPQITVASPSDPRRVSRKVRYQDPVGCNSLFVCDLGASFCVGDILGLDVSFVALYTLLGYLRTESNQSLPFSARPVAACGTRACLFPDRRNQ